jgi:hypothetical protein
VVRCHHLEARFPGRVVESSQPLANRPELWGRFPIYRPEGRRWFDPVEGRCRATHTSKKPGQVRTKLRSPRER